MEVAWRAAGLAEVQQEELALYHGREVCAPLCAPRARALYAHHLPSVYDVCMYVYCTQGGVHPTQGCTPHRRMRCGAYTPCVRARCVQRLSACTVRMPCTCAQVSRAEVACLASHAAAWRAAERADLEWVVVVEDDVAPHSGGGWGGQGGGGSAQCYARLWARVWWRVSTEVAALEAAALRPVGGGEGSGGTAAAAAGAAASGAISAWELIFLGRNRLGRDGAAVGLRLVVPGFSSCAHAYALSRRGYRRLLRLLPRVAEAALPVDELLPALCTAHPREDVAAWAAQLLRWEAMEASKAARPAQEVHEVAQEVGSAEGAGSARPRVLSAFAFRDDLVWQLEAIATGAPMSCLRLHPHPQRRPRPLPLLLPRPSVFALSSRPQPSALPSTFTRSAERAVARCPRRRCLRTRRAAESLRYPAASRARPPACTCPRCGGRGEGGGSDLHGDAGRL